MTYSNPLSPVLAQVAQDFSAATKLAQRQFNDTLIFLKESAAAKPVQASELCAVASNASDLAAAQAAEWVSLATKQTQGAIAALKKQTELHTSAFSPTLQTVSTIAGLAEKAALSFLVSGEKTAPLTAKGKR